jgi:hypothetical protein
LRQRELGIYCFPEFVLIADICGEINELGNCRGFDHGVLG